MLVIVGDGDLRGQFEMQARELGIADRVHFVGKVAHSKLGPIYSASDILVLPSFPPESFGVVLLEAMACGRPVVAHDIPGVRSVVSDGEDGFLAHPGQTGDLQAKLQILLNDHSRRREMGLRGRAKVEECYAWSGIIPRLEKLYELACGDC
jgi:glycosyltransferase involved in cell wall biosynthesis